MNAQIKAALDAWNAAKERELTAMHKAAAAAEAFVDGTVTNAELIEWVDRLKVARNNTQNTFKAYVATYSRSY